MTPSPAGDIIGDLVTKLAANFHAEAKAYYAGYLGRLVAEYSERCAASGKTSPYDLWPTVRGTHPYAAQANAEKQRVISRFLNCDAVSRTYSLFPDLDARIERASISHADNVVASFKAKLLAKLSDIIAAKGNLTTAELKGHLGRNVISAAFADGSSFAVLSQVVHKCSPLGRPFSQYPTTFHNVILPDGSRVSQVSEFKVKKVFCGIDIVEKAKAEKATKNAPRIEAANVRAALETAKRARDKASDQWSPAMIRECDAAGINRRAQFGADSEWFNKFYYSPSVGTLRRFLDQKTENAAFLRVIAAMRPLAEEIVRLNGDADLRRAAVKALPKK